jgi:hypothetical protein
VVAKVRQVPALRVLVVLHYNFLQVNAALHWLQLQCIVHVCVQVVLMHVVFLWRLELALYRVRIVLFSSLDFALRLLFFLVFRSVVSLVDYLKVE